MAISTASERPRPRIIQGFKRLLRSGLRRVGYDFGRYDPNVSIDRYLRMLFDNFAIDCVLDVGANTGQFASFLRRNRYSGHIVSFEPLSQPFAELERRRQRDLRWTAHLIALGNEQTTAPMNVMAESAWSSFHEPATDSLPAFFPEARQREKIERVEMTRLDDVFEKVTSHLTDPKVYLKLDTQGWDLEVLKGARRTLDSVLALQTEIGMKPMYQDAPRYWEVTEYLDEAGFDVSAFFPVSRHGLAVVEFDCVAIRRDAVPQPAST